jgi:hypothetical protein
MYTRIFALCIIICVAASCAGDPGSGGGTVLYVAPDGDDTASGSKSSPLASLDGARQAVRSLDGPVTVLFGGGLYEMDAPVTFTPEDSGTSDAPIIYAAAPGETPILSGGRVIDGWREEGGRWVTDVPAVKAGDWDFIQLFVNGELRKRARIPNEGFHIVAGFPGGTSQDTGTWPQVHYHFDGNMFQYAPGDIDPNWHNFDDVEVIVFHFWTDSHLPIASIDTEKRYVTFKHNAGKVFTDDFTADGARYIVENVREGLDAPGEWYLDRVSGVLEYIPMAGETLAAAEVIAPVIPKFMDFTGDPMAREYVEHISFGGLSFQYTNWRLPEGNSNDRQGSASVPAAITTTGARYIAFEDCAIKNTGTWAFEIGQGCSYNRIVGNEISYVAAGGFRVNGGAASSHPLIRTGYNTITDNHLNHYGELYPSAVGVLMMNTSGNLVAHNEIDHGWYTGVSIGWSWGYQRSISRDNVVEFNHIHDIGQTGLLSDMGGIYTLGVSPGTVLRNNLIHDVNSNHYGGWGIYNDEGSTHILVENNVVYDTKFAGYNIHYAKEITVRNNIFALSTIDELSLGRVEPHISCFFEGNIVYWTEGTLMRNFKVDEEYDFHYRPGAPRKASRTLELDYNVYFNPGETPAEVQIGEQNFLDWQEVGRDTKSVYADPMFMDVDARDFRLKPGSPAYDMGFVDIDVSEVGPRR